MFALRARLRRYAHCLTRAHQAMTINRGVLVCRRFFLPYKTLLVACTCGREWLRRS